MVDKSKELVRGAAMNKAIMQCLSCACIVECERENHPIHTDSDGNCLGWTNGVEKLN